MIATIHKSVNDAAMIGGIKMLGMCGDCKFYFKNDGVCRRFPPIVVTYSGTVGISRTEWPEVKEKEVCGEYQDATK